MIMWNVNKKSFLLKTSFINIYTIGEASETAVCSSLKKMWNSISNKINFRASFAKLSLLGKWKI